jgi:exodeoxyribonuclease-3
MKIITWNVNGLRATLKKGGLDWMRRQEPDVFCLQEIKARPDQITREDLQQLDGYHAYWNPALKPGYSGVATFTRALPLEARYGVGRSEFDGEGRVICTRHPGFLLFNVYFPSGQRGQGRVEFKLDFYAHLLGLCDQLHANGEQIVICGDFNTAHREIDLKNAKQNVHTSGFLPEERVWIDKYLEHGFLDIYRLRNPERIQYTWWTYVGKARERNTGWRLDYFLISGNLAGQVQDVIIHDDVPSSDHCPVMLVID